MIIGLASPIWSPKVPSCVTPYFYSVAVLLFLIRKLSVIPQSLPGKGEEASRDWPSPSGRIWNVNYTSELFCPEARELGFLLHHLTVVG